MIASINDFVNNSFYLATVSVSGAQFNFASNSRFRIRCDASSNKDQAFIDQVIITGINSVSARLSSIAKQSPINSNIEFVRNGPSDLSLIGELDIYPNPVKGAYLNLALTKQEPASYFIYDILGKKVLSGKTTDRINVSRLQKGIYIIEINDGEEILRKKFIRQ